VAFFAMSYRIHFDDTMAYGSHHYVTNFKFQSMLRETLLFHSADLLERGREELQSMIILTAEAYSRNLAPVSLGARVGLMLSYADPTRSSVKLCFRAVRADGEPVSCGYQSIVCVDRSGAMPVPAPSAMRGHIEVEGPENLLERPHERSFMERAIQGGKAVESLFDPDVVRVGRYMASCALRESHPRIIGFDLKEYPFVIKGVTDHAAKSA